MVRFKNRYITVEITLKDGEERLLVLKPSALYHAVQKSVEKMYGDFGLASIKAGLNAQYCNPHTRIALIKCRHGPHNFLINAIPTINDVGGKFVEMKILYVGATMKNCFLFIKKHQRKTLETAWGTLRNDQEKKKMIEILMTLTSEMKDFR
ncbi:ribonuclease P/MRP protein subunit POP5 [Diachasmimorpha longicaudata]|uniref:ribonuclease P/MRP protein subunit POP5 n=1 Tax=Diachasmimorpha longicaudata TaxID=58733 RepID=UPI0030B8F0E0